jgi:hypothetical protein
MAIALPISPEVYATCQARQSIIVVSVIHLKGQVICFWVYANLVARKFKLVIDGMKSKSQASSFKFKHELKIEMSSLNYFCFSKFTFAGNLALCLKLKN